MSSLPTTKWFLVCNLYQNQIKVVKRESFKTAAIEFMKENDDGTYFIIEVIA